MNRSLAAPRSKRMFSQRQTPFDHVRFLHVRLQLLYSKRQNIDMSQPTNQNSPSRDYNKKFCDDCKKEIAKTNWSKHIKTKKHVGERPNSSSHDKKFCDDCNKEITKTNWSRHAKTKKHLGGCITKQCGTTKYCNCCNKVLKKANWARHAKTYKHINSLFSLLPK